MVPVTGQALLSMLDIETLDVLTINCNIMDTQKQNGYLQQDGGCTNNVYVILCYMKQAILKTAM